MDTHLSVFFVFFIREFVNRPWSAICCVVPNIVALSDCQKVWYIYIIFNDPGCICIWKCNLFYIRMLSLQQSKRRIEIKTSFLHELKIEVLLFGDDTLTEMQNLQIFKSVQLYIKRTKRFTHLSSQTPNILFLIKQSIHFISDTSMVKHAYIRLFHAFFCFFLYFLLLRLLFFSFFKDLFIMLYIVFHYCWRMYYCNYLLCGEDPCKLL